MKKISTRSLAQAGLIAAAYMAVSVALAPFSFGAVQVRVSEALTLLPVLSAVAVPGVTIGCLLTNAWGVAAGANLLGVLDIPLGTAATLIAALLTRCLRRRPWLAALPPVLCNAVIIGAELMALEAGGLSLPLFAVNALQVGAGEAVACCLLGLPLLRMLRGRFGDEETESG